MGTPPVARTRLVVFFAVLLSSCGDGPTAPAGVATTLQITSPATLTFTQSVQTAQIAYEVRDQNGALMSVTPLFDSSAPTLISVDATGRITGLANGSAVVSVRLATLIAQVNVTVAVSPTPLTAGVAVTSLAGPQLSLRYFTFEVPPGSDDRVLQFRLRGGTGDADLWVRHLSASEPGVWDCQSSALFLNLDRIEVCAVPAPASGTWHVSVRGFDEYAGVSLDARIVPLVSLTPGIARTGLAAPTLDLLYFEIYPPASTTMMLTTTGGSGDADLFATNRTRLDFPSLYGAPCASFEDGSNESCSPFTQDGGRWTVVLFGFSSFADVSLLAEVTPFR